MDEEEEHTETTEKNNQSLHGGMVTIDDTNEEGVKPMMLLAARYEFELGQERFRRREGPYRTGQSFF